MSHTNSTTNYGLPQFLTSDKPAWLTDVNNAFSDIDTAVYNAQTKADTAYTDAGNAQGDATTAINNAAAADAKGSGAIASIEAAFDPTTIYSVGAKVMYNSLLYRCIVAVVTPGPWTGSDNWERITVDSLISTTDSKIGYLTSLSTIDKTSIVNAVNEVNNSLTNYNTSTVTDIFATYQGTMISDVVVTQMHKVTSMVLRGTIPAGNWQTIGTVKDRFKNSVPNQFFAVIDTTSNYIGMMYLGTDGTVNFFLQGSGNKNVDFGFTYIAQ